MASVGRITGCVLVVFVSLLCLAFCVDNKDGRKRSKPLSRKNAEWTEPVHYIDNVTSLFATKLEEYGVGNLPVADKIYEINVTRYNIPLLGRLNFINGFVANIRNISRHAREYIWYFDGTGANIQFKLNLRNVSIFYNLEADLEISTSVASAVLTFPTNYVLVGVRYDLLNHSAKVTTMTTNSVAGPRTSFTPESAVVKAVAYNARLTMASSLFSDMTIWISHSLQSVLESVVNDLPFPLKIKRARRRPGKRALRLKRPRTKPTLATNVK